LALDTITILAGAVRKLQREVSDLKKKAAEPRVVYVGGGGGMSKHGNEYHSPNFHPVDSDLLPEVDGLNLGSSIKRFHGLFMRDVAPGYQTIIDMSWGDAVADTIQIMGGGGVGDPRLLLILGAKIVLHLRPTYIELGSNVNLLGGINSVLGSASRPFTAGYIDTPYVNSLYVTNVLGNDFDFINFYDPIRVDVINEKTLTGGVTIDGVLCKDGTITPTNGATGTFTSADGKTVTVTNGIITSIV